MDMQSVHIVILAAGNSTRFGADKRVYTLPLVLNAIFELIGETCGNVLCVLKADDINQLDIVAGEYSHDKRIEFCWNTLPESGVGHSLALAAQCLRAKKQLPSSAMIFLADMPFIQVDTLRTLVSQAQTDAIIAPVYKGRRGHPVIFGSEFFADLEQLQGDTGARHLLVQYASQLVLVDVNDQGTIIDIDTPADWQQAQHIVTS